jgi:hypothetical protein
MLIKTFLNLIALQKVKQLFLDEQKAFCSQNEFICLQSSTCISLKMRCDGKKDCENGEDEMLCGKIVRLFRVM